jgi:hypothetical protein
MRPSFALGESLPLGFDALVALNGLLPLTL